MQDTLEASAPQARALVLDWLASQQQAMQDLLQKVVNIDSGSRDEAGVTAVAHALAERLQAAGVPVKPINVEVGAFANTEGSFAVADSADSNRSISAVRIDSTTSRN